MRWHPHLCILPLGLLLSACKASSPGSTPPFSSEKEAVLSAVPTSKLPPTAAPDPEPIPWKTKTVLASSPVIVELFTSEGCSSCPPADDLLKDIAERQPIDGADVIALEMHVDYWNDLGWADPFSNEAFTRRQRVYVNAFGESRVYTPHMVVDGRVGFVGSNSRAANREILQAKSLPKATVTIEPLRGEGALSIVISNLPLNPNPVDVMLAIVEDGLKTNVLRGENAGSILVHAPIVRSLAAAFSLPAAHEEKTFSKKVGLTIAPSWKKERLRAVVFVQDKESLGILGASETTLNAV